MITLNNKILDAFTVDATLVGYVRSLKRDHSGTPLGMGYGLTRFASPSKAFQLIYLAADPKTSVAEAIVRDRFQHKAKREMAEEEFDLWSMCEITRSAKFKLLDLRADAPTLLNIPTDAVNGRNHKAGRAFSERLYSQTSLDGILYPSRFTKKDCVALYDKAITGRITASASIDLPRLRKLTDYMDELKIEVIRMPGPSLV
ncbi:hypothetical protein MMA231_04004 (plasmid) [Asticcacaulis sp. MM231]|uniref:RES family NAD+ phosphorylase n=1 Tax=Asticcacaulis sp. MM231 TaxID=3157666 RepID=UPI0032D57576